MNLFRFEQERMLHEVDTFCRSVCHLLWTPEKLQEYRDQNMPVPACVDTWVQRLVEGVMEFNAGSETMSTRIGMKVNRIFQGKVQNYGSGPGQVAYGIIVNNFMVLNRDEKPFEDLQDPDPARDAHVADLAEQALVAWFYEDGGFAQSSWEPWDRLKLAQTKEEAVAVNAAYLRDYHAAKEQREKIIDDQIAARAAQVAHRYRLWEIVGPQERAELAKIGCTPETDPAEFAPQERHLSELGHQQLAAYADDFKYRHGGVLPYAITNWNDPIPSYEYLYTHTTPAREWRAKFKSAAELDKGDIVMLISNFFPEGNVFIGGLPGGGKTWLALSIVKALTTGKPLFGRPDFVVPKITPALYMIPEVGARAFRKRLEKFHITDDENLFLCRTISEGATLDLNDPALLGAVASMRPVVFLDTTIRFNKAESENDARANSGLVDAIVRLRQAGAAAIIALHHSTKAAREGEMTLEKVLRGTGDMAASADAVYGMRRDDKLYDNGRGPEEFEVECVKPRDFVPPAPFRIAASRKSTDSIASYKAGLTSNFDQVGDFVLVGDAQVMDEFSSRINQMLTDDPKLTLSELQERTGKSPWVIRKAYERLGWHRGKTKDSIWERGIALPTAAAPEPPQPLPKGSQPPAANNKSFD
jgi:hypothetical protein